MNKYSVTKGPDGKYKLSKKEVAVPTIKDKDEIGREALDARLKQEKK